MSKRKYDKPIAGHEYDGIQELNNPLPKWWLATFFGTIVFALLYFGYYVLGNGPSQDATLASRMAKIEGRTEAHQAAAASVPETEQKIDVDKIMHDKAAMAAGKSVFETNCAPCHGQQGEGSIGPNLTDKYWLHSKGDVAGILKSFREGFPDKGMPPWDKLIPPDEQVPLAVYVKSLQGTNPPNPKEPQGQLVDGSATGDGEHAGSEENEEHEE